MSGLRDRLDAKARRRVVVPIPVTDPGDDARRTASEAAAALSIAGLAGLSETRQAELREAHETAQAQLEEHTAAVALLAMPAADWEALTAAYLLDDGEDLDWRGLLPHALAACCEDEDLQDADWWASKLDDPAWSAGDIAALRRAVLHLNQWAPPAFIPKG